MIYSIYTCVFIIYFFGGDTGDGTQGVTLARQVLYFLSQSTSPIYVFKYMEHS
jgi:hypothetical protein